jgi:hypothetical protein
MNRFARIDADYDQIKRVATAFAQLLLGLKDQKSSEEPTAIEEPAVDPETTYPIQDIIYLLFGDSLDINARENQRVIWEGLRIFAGFLYDRIEERGMDDPIVRSVIKQNKFDPVGAELLFDIIKSDKQKHSTR